MGDTEYNFEQIKLNLEDLENKIKSFEAGGAQQEVLFLRKLNVELRQAVLFKEREIESKEISIKGLIKLLGQALQDNKKDEKK